jgi:hypothetical protein
MNRLMTTFLVLGAGQVWALPGQDAQATAAQEQQPIYRLTVEQRTIRAVNYGHRSEPTKVDYRGTVILPQAKGEARVESKAGAVEVDSKFEGLAAPTRFGPQYLAYVLWAITPDGRPVNLGEVLPDGSNKAKLKVTTQLQAFGLIVTAEPYFAVTQPSNVVVMENVLRPDTAGKVEEVEAKYELLHRNPTSGAPRTFEVGQQQPSPGKKVPIDQYEAVLALYQAQNALQIARSEGADKYAADTLRKADQLYQEAQKLQGDKTQSKRVVTLAREAAQAAGDARSIAAAHRQPAAVR